MNARTVAVAVALATPVLTATARGAESSGHMPQPPHVQIVYADCPWSGLPNVGCAYPDGRVFVADRTDTFTREHETGHVFDFEEMNDGDRAWFGRRLNRGEPWAPDTREIFADLWAGCDLRLKREYNGFWTGGYTWTTKLRRALCRAIVRVGQRYAEHVEAA